MEFRALDHLIALFLRGSQAYGLATPESDVDLGGVLIPPKEYFLGFSKTFNQTEDISDIVEEFGGKAFDTANGVEGTIYGLKKFLKLCSDCNPNMIEMLFMDDDSYIVTTPAFELLRENRNLFLSKKARFTFSGYAFSQINRIKSHRKWLLNPLKAKPERKDYDLPELPTSQYREAEQLIKKTVDQWGFHEFEIDTYNQIRLRKKLREQLSTSLCIEYPNLRYDDESARQAAMHRIGFDDNLMKLLSKENEYRTDLNQWKNYQTWLKTRNKKRAELENNFAFDCKHGMHVVRLMLMGEEILEKGTLTVKRTEDREMLLDVRRGKWSYEEMIEFAEKKQTRFEELYKSSSLSNGPNLKKIEALCVEIVEKAIV